MEALLSVMECPEITAGVAKAVGGRKSQWSLRGAL